MHSPQLPPRGARHRLTHWDLLGLCHCLHCSQNPHNEDLSPEQWQPQREAPSSLPCSCCSGSKPEITACRPVPCSPLPLAPGTVPLVGALAALWAQPHDGLQEKTVQAPTPQGGAERTGGMAKDTHTNRPAGGSAVSTQVPLPVTAAPQARVGGAHRTSVSETGVSTVPPTTERRARMWSAKGC